MAKPLPLVLKPPEVSNDADVRDELQRKLSQAPIEHAAAIVSFYKLLQALHDSGTLDALRGFFAAEDDVIGRIASALNSPETVRSVRNMIALTQIVGSVDPNVFESLRDAVTEAVENSNDGSARPPGLWTILKRADSENSLRTLAVATDFLEGFGRRLKSGHNGSGHDGPEHAGS